MGETLLPPAIFDNDIKAKGLAKSWRKGHEIKGFAGASWRRDGASVAEAQAEAMLDDIPNYRFSQCNILYT